MKSVQTRYRRLFCGALAMAALAAAPAAQADQSYPNRAVRMLVPYPAGQATDVAARLLADELSRKWGQSVYVDNRAGGAAIPGMVAAKEAAPDGYTIILGTSAALVVNPLLFQQLPYAPFQDFTLVSGLFRNPLLIVANANTPFKTLDDLVKAAKARPGQINWGYPGTGNTQHLSGELFKHMADIKLENIMYKGSAQTVTDLVSGQIPVAVDSIAATMALIKDGKLRALALTGAQRAPQLPDVATVAELGYPGYEGEGWGGIIVPKATPEAVVGKLEQDILATMRTPAFQQALIARGLIPFVATQAEWQAYSARDGRKWAEVAKRAGIKPQ